jgi:hypothetical protein
LPDDKASTLLAFTAEAASDDNAADAEIEQVTVVS